MNLKTGLRLLAGWASVAVLMLGADTVLDVSSPVVASISFLWLFAVILWSSFGVVHEAEELAVRLGEPVGTLVLTLAIVKIENAVA